MRSPRPHRGLAALIAILVLIGSIPLGAGATFQSDGPVLTLDICHPLQSAAQSAGLTIAPIPAQCVLAESLPQSGSVLHLTAPTFRGISDPPDPPPPEALS